jgi:hypothetical protein
MRVLIGTVSLVTDIAISTAFVLLGAFVERSNPVPLGDTGLLVAAMVCAAIASWARGVVARRSRQ